MKSAFEAGFTDDDVNFRRGINQIRRVRLSDGTIAYLKNITGGQNEVFRELSAGRMFEAMGIDSVVITSVRDPRGNKPSILIREVPNDGVGAGYIGDRLNLINGNKIALFDYLVANGDRHNGNWLFKGNSAFPIDHGLTQWSRYVPPNLNLVRGDGAFGELMTDWVTGRRQIFNQSEFMQIRERILNLRAMYESMSTDMGDYFKEAIAPRLDVLLGIWR